MVPFHFSFNKRTNIKLCKQGKLTLTLSVKSFDYFFVSKFHAKFCLTEPRVKRVQLCQKVTLVILRQKMKQ